MAFGAPRRLMPSLEPASAISGCPCAGFQLHDEIQWRPDRVPPPVVGHSERIPPKFGLGPLASEVQSWAYLASTALHTPSILR